MEIPLTQGKVCHIDLEDWPLVRDFSWYAALQSDGQNWYVLANAWDKVAKKEYKVQIHRVILGAKPGEYVDHWDGDTFNCRRSNLRACTNAQNQQNTGSRGGTSRFKGVSWNSRRKKWRVAFNCNGRFHWVGYFDDETEAAKAYNAAVLPLAGEFARLNDVSDLSENVSQTARKPGIIWKVAEGEGQREFAVSRGRERSPGT